MRYRYDLRSNLLNAISQKTDVNLNTYIHDLSLSWLGRGFQLKKKDNWVILILWAQNPHCLGNDATCELNANSYMAKTGLNLGLSTINKVEINPLLFTYCRCILKVNNLNLYG